MMIAAMTFRLHAPWAHSLMDEMTRFVETATDAQLLEESLEIR